MIEALRSTPFFIREENIEEKKGSQGNVFPYQEGKSLLIAKYYDTQFEYYPRGVIAEVAALRTLSHPNIIRPRGAIITPCEDYISKTHFVTLLLSSGCASLKDWAEKKDKGKCPIYKRLYLPSILYQILRGVAYLHEQGFLHRDLKPDNVIIFENEKVPLVQLADFATAVRTVGPSYDKPELYSAIVCTLRYRAPEVLLYYLPEREKRHFYIPYDASSDMWSMGVIFYELLTGKEFLQAAKEEDILVELAELYDQRGNFRSHVSEYLRSVVPPEAYDLLCSLLTLNPEDRMSAREALGHPYFRRIIVRKTKRLFPEEKSTPFTIRVYTTSLTQLILTHGGNTLTASMANSLYERTAHLVIEDIERLYACIYIAYQLTSREEEIYAYKQRIMQEIGRKEDKTIGETLFAIALAVKFDFYA